MTQDVTALVQALLQHGMTQEQISEAIDRRAGPRSIYRWGKGQARPRNTATVEALQRLVREKGAVVA